MEYGEGLRKVMLVVCLLWRVRRVEIIGNGIMGILLVCGLVWNSYGKGFKLIVEIVVIFLYEFREVVGSY